MDAVEGAEKLRELSEEMRSTKNPEERDEIMQERRKVLESMMHDR